MSVANITAKWQSLRPFLAELGTRDRILYLLQRLLNALPGSPQLLKYYLVAQSVPAVAIPANHAYRFSVVEQGAYQTDWFPRLASVIRARFEQNATCLVAFSDEKPIACLWYVVGDYEEDVVRCKFLLPPGISAWDFDVYIHPDYRLTRVFGLLWDFAFTHMRRHHIAWSLSRIDAFNLRSLRSHQHLGARITGSVLFLWFGRFQLTVPPRGNIHMSRTATPLIQVSAPDSADRVTG